MGTDRCKSVIGMVCEQDMDHMFVLLEIEFRHRIGANIVSDYMGSMLDCMDYMGYLLDGMKYMLDNGICIESTVKV